MKKRPKEKSNADADAPLVGRSEELATLSACLGAHTNVLLEGPVGVGKTKLAIEATRATGLKVFRVDGDSRFTEQKLTGYFDPPLILKKGYSEASFIAGPLILAMREGGVLFINELNRLPEGVQNVLLPAIDERQVQVPKLGTIRAHPDFRVLATQNPKEFVATSHLSEALLDRFELLTLDYQTEDEEIAIVRACLDFKSQAADELASYAVGLVRSTRNSERIKRGASVRAAQSLSRIAQAFLKSGRNLEAAFREAAFIALPTRIEIERGQEGQLTMREEVREIIEELLSGIFSEKKKH